MGNVFTLPKYAEHGSIATASTGSVYTNLGGATQQVRRVIVVNDTGTSIEVKRNSGLSTVAIPISSIYCSQFIFDGVSALSDLAVRRVDVSNTNVTVKFAWEY